MSKKKQGLLFGVRIDLNSSADEEDDEYVPQSDPEEKKKSKRIDKNGDKSLLKRRERISKIWAEMMAGQELKPEEVKKEEPQAAFDRAMKIASELMEHNRSNDQKTVIFAGKSYKVDSQGTFINTGEKESEMMIEEAEVKLNGHEDENEEKAFEREREIRRERFKYLAKILEKINSKAKVINSMAKSKMDWKHFSNKERLDKKFEQNRKNGFLEKQKFISNTNERAYEITTRRKKQKPGEV